MQRDGTSLGAPEWKWGILASAVHDVAGKSYDPIPPVVHSEKHVSTKPASLTWKQLMRILSSLQIQSQQAYRLVPSGSNVLPGCTVLVAAPSKLTFPADEQSGLSLAHESERKAFEANSRAFGSFV